MSVEQIEATIESMPVSERQRFVRWVDQHRHELLPEIEIAQQAEVLNRLTESDANPELLEPFEEADLERMIQDTVNAHAKKSSARQR